MEQIKAGGNQVGQTLRLPMRLQKETADYPSEIDAAPQGATLGESGQNVKTYETDYSRMGCMDVDRLQ